MEGHNFTYPFPVGTFVIAPLTDSVVVPAVVPAVVPVVVLSLCFLLGVPGNLAVVVFLRRNPLQLSGLCRLLMLNLAASDLLCLLFLPAWIYRFFYSLSLGLVACKLLAYLSYCSIYGSILTVTSLSVVRYVRVVQLQRGVGLGRWVQSGLLVLLWMAAGVLSVPALVFWGLFKHEGRMVCGRISPSREQHLVLPVTEFLLGFLIPLSVMTSAYVSLYWRVKQSPFFNNSNNNPKTSKLMTCIVGMFFALWMPYHVINFLDVAAILLEKESLLQFSKNSLSIIIPLTFLHSCLDPLVYVFATLKFGVTCCKLCDVSSAM